MRVKYSCNASNARQIPVIHCNGPMADEAFIRHRALSLALREDPTLADDVCFMALKAEAYQRFLVALDKV